MPHGETVSGLYEFLEGDLYATVELTDSGEGWVSEWWVSRKFDSDLGVQLIGYIRLPVFGETREDAVRRIGFIYEDVVNLARDVSGGSGSVGAGNDVKRTRAHAKAHLQYWLDMGLGITKTEQTSVMYALAVDFGMNNPAALIAEVEVVGVRAVHERIAYARRIGLLSSHGRGRVRKAEAESEADVDVEIEEPKKGYKIRREGVWYEYE